MEVTRTFDLLSRIEDKFAEQPDILACKKSGQWICYSGNEYVRMSHLVSYALLSMGLEKGDHVVTVMSNRPEWNIIDMGLALAGIVHVPVYPTLSIDDYKYIISHSDAKMLIIGGEQFYDRIKPAIDLLEDSCLKICVVNPVGNMTNFDNILEIGEQNTERYREIIEENKRSIDPEDMVTMIYTSGTTGAPKGVMLSHRSVVFNFLAHARMQIKGQGNRMLSFLPLCHIYERSMNYEYQYQGISIYYAESLATIATDLHDIHADGFCAVPRVLEMMFDKLRAAGKDMSGLKKMIYFWAFDLAERFDYENNNWWYNIQHKLADKLVYSKWREKLGGKEMLIVAGGSSIQARIIRLFSAAKQYIFEGYGMTETSPVIAVNNPMDMIITIGTVGKPIPGIEVILGEDGEILTRGHHVMLGYYKDPEYTSKVIDENGWLHTGDIGVFDNNGFLKITDRKKEIFKLSSGKYIAPQVIENRLKESSFIENAYVVGENEKFATAIIVPNMSVLHFWAAKHKIHFSNNNDLILKQKVITRIGIEVDNVNKILAPHENIKKFRIVSDEWTPQNGCLSQTLKLKRSVLRSRYRDIFLEIYGIDKKEEL